jgi:hypothetical protein
MNLNLWVLNEVDERREMFFKEEDDEVVDI